MPEQNTTAASGAVAAVETPAFNAEDTSTWTAEQKSEWVETGKLTAPPQKAQQDSAPASSSESKTQPAPKGKTAAESGAASQQEKESKSGKDDKPTAEARIDELTGKLRAVERQLEEARRQKPDPKAETKSEAKVEPPKRPNPFKWTGTPEEFDAAMDVYEKALREHNQREFQETLARNARSQQFLSQVQTARERYGADAFDAVVEPASKAIMDQAQPAVKEYLQQSEMFADLLYVLGGTEKSLTDFLATAKSNPVAAMRKLAFLEIEIGKELQAKAGKKNEARPGSEKDLKDEKKDSPAKPAPRAPEPPPVVGGRGAASDRPDHAAARDGNFSAFETEMNRKYGSG